MSMIQEFKAFAMRGNVADMAVGIIIGAAFGKIVSSLVNDVLMPPIGMLVGGVDFSGLGITLRAATAEAPAVVMKYGLFVNSIIDFIIVAFAIFLMIRALNTLKKKEEEAPAAPAAPPKQEVLLEEIRDLLKAGKR
jgi:large conductance mechanosensitive channel